jgi:hypothetical protein
MSRGAVQSHVAGLVIATHINLDCLASAVTGHTRRSLKRESPDGLTQPNRFRNTSQTFEGFSAKRLTNHGYQWVP